MRATALTFALIVVTTAGVGAQEEVDDNRLSFTASLVSVLTGPASSAAGQLGALGYDKTSPGGCLFGFCAGPQSHPRVEREPGGTFTARYEVTERWAASVGFAVVGLGSGHGFRSGSPSVESHWSDQAGWALAHIKPVRRVSFGAGLSLHALEGADRREAFADAIASRVRATRVGLTAEAALRLREYRTLFLQATLRGHLIPGSVSLTHNRMMEPVTVSVRPGYATLEIGVGVRP